MMTEMTMDEFVAYNDYNSTILKYPTDNNCIVVVTLPCWGRSVVEQKCFYFTTNEEFEEIIKPILYTEPWRISVYNEDGKRIWHEHRNMGYCYEIGTPEADAVLEWHDKAVEKLKAIDKEIKHQNMLARRREKRRAKRELEKRKKEHGLA